MSDETLTRLMRLGQQAEARAIRLSQLADRACDDESRCRAVDAWRSFAEHWDAVRAYEAAHADGQSRVGHSRSAEPAGPTEPFRVTVASTPQARRDARSRGPAPISRSGSLADEVSSR